MTFSPSQASFALLFGSIDVFNIIRFNERRRWLHQRRGLDFVMIRRLAWSNLFAQVSGQVALAAAARRDAAAERDQIFERAHIRTCSYSSKKRDFCRHSHL